MIDFHHSPLNWMSDSLRCALILCPALLLFTPLESVAQHLEQDPALYGQTPAISALPETGYGQSKRFFSGQVSQTGVIPEPQPEVEPPSPGIVGLDLVVRPHSYPFVKDVFEGTPADDEGIAAGDYIVAVNGASTFGKTRVQVDDQIPDKPGTPITFQIQRQGQLYQVKVTVASLRQLPLTTQNFFMAPSP
jgi:C-terminal processing protease CtpA/Prc